MEMTNDEILRSYKQAKDQRAQIKILAELNLCSRTKIAEILIEGGVDPKNLHGLPKYPKGSPYTPTKKQMKGQGRRWVWNPNKMHQPAPDGNQAPLAVKDEASPSAEWEDDYGATKCSACGFSCGDDYYLGAGRFCPECGAKMKKPLREEKTK